MLDIIQLAGRILAPDTAAAAEAQKRLDAKTKPRRSLGRLEDLVCQLAAVRGGAAPWPPPEKAIVVMGADHGVAAEGVSAYPQEVTGQMLLNFARQFVKHSAFRPKSKEGEFFRLAESG